MTTLIKTSNSKKSGYTEAFSGSDALIAHSAGNAVSVPPVQSEELTLDQLTEKLARENTGFAAGLAEQLKSFSALGTTDQGGVTITSLRMAAGLTQSQLADKVGMRQPNVSALEAGQNGNLKRETMLRLCQAFGCDMNTLNTAIDNTIAMLEAYHAQQEAGRNAVKDAA